MASKSPAPLNRRIPPKRTTTEKDRRSPRRTVEAPPGWQEPLLRSHSASFKRKTKGSRIRWPARCGLRAGNPCCVTVSVAWQPGETLLVGRHDGPGAGSAGAARKTEICAVRRAHITTKAKCCFRKTNIVFAQWPACFSIVVPFPKSHRIFPKRYLRCVNVRLADARTRHRVRSSRPEKSWLATRWSGSSGGSPRESFQSSSHQLIQARKQSLRRSGDPSGACRRTVLEALPSHHRAPRLAVMARR